jgi:hypothetical protein
MIITEKTVNNRNKRAVVKHEKKLTKLHLPKRVSKVSGKPSVLNSATNMSSRTLTIDEHDALNNDLHQVYTSNKLEQARCLHNMEYYHTRTLNFTTTYCHYEQKEVHHPVVHQL